MEKKTKIIIIVVLISLLCLFSLFSNKNIDDKEITDIKVKFLDEDTINLYLNKNLTSDIKIINEDEEQILTLNKNGRNIYNEYNKKKFNTTHYKITLDLKGKTSPCKNNIDGCYNVDYIYNNDTIIQIEDLKIFLSENIYEFIKGEYPYYEFYKSGHKSYEEKIINNKITKFSYWENGNLKEFNNSIIIMKFNENNQTIYKKDYGVVCDGLVKEVFYEFDENGNNIKKFDNCGNLVEYKFNENNQITYWESNKGDYVKFEYKPENIVIKEIYNKNYDKTSLIEMMIDENGNVISQKYIKR